MSILHLTPEQIRWQRFQRVGLVEPFADAPSAAMALVGIQAQILAAAGLALWNRIPTFSQNSLDDLLLKQRTLVKLWGQRHTLHLYASTDWPLIHAARSINSSWWQRNIADDPQAIASHHQLIESVAAILRSQESMGRSDLRASGLPLSNELLSPWGGIFSELVRLGYACHYGRSEGEGRFVARERWLPDLVWDPPDATSANLTIVQRYMAGYGPATLQDFAYWRGVGISEARPWFEAIKEELVEVDLDGQKGFLRQSDAEAAQLPPPPPEAWPVRLLYRFDPYLLAHRNKDWVVPPAHYKAVFRPAGHIEGIVAVRGQAAGVWRYDRKGSGLIITVNPFKPLPKYVLKQVEKRAKQIAAFFNGPLVELVVNAPT